MTTRSFTPIWIILPGSPPRRVDNAFEAMECLTAEWPKQGRTWRLAVQACRDALDGVIPAASARYALLAAAQEVGAQASRETGQRSTHVELSTTAAGRTAAH